MPLPAAQLRPAALSPACRPDAPDGSLFLKLVLGPSGSVASVVGPVQRALASPAAKAEASAPRARAGGAAMEAAFARGLVVLSNTQALTCFHPSPQGYVWRDLSLYESDEIKPLQRFLADVPLSGGAWLHLPPAEPGRGQAAAGAAAGVGAGPSSGQVAAAAAAHSLGWRPVPESEQVSRCDVEAEAHWRAVCCLSPDASQLADPTWTPLAAAAGGGGGCPQAAGAEPAVLEAAEAAARGDIVGLRMAVLDVLCATADGTDRCGAWPALL